MGMDVIGTKPDAVPGEYFRASIWSWPPLWGAVEQIAPDLASKVRNPYHNDGGGLDAEDSKTLGTRILTFIEEHPALHTLETEEDSAPDFNRAMLAMLRAMEAGQPNPITEAVHAQDVAEGKEISEPLNIVEPQPAKDSGGMFSTDVAHLREFGVFLTHCGGFEIW